MARAFLLIADIGGYTRFMSVHRINLAHAQYVIAQLLEAVIDAAGSKLTLAKLEGDAAFFYATLPDRGEINIDPQSRAVAEIRRAFLHRREELSIQRLCSCDGCVQASALKLKFVAHVGEIAFQKVKHYNEVAGVDVIFVHRLLKNSVPVSEYVLLSDPLYQRLAPDLQQHASSQMETLEGLGEARTWYIDLDAIARALPSTLKPSFFGKLAAWLAMTFRSLPYYLGVRKACEGFQNLGPALAPKDAPQLPSRAAAGP